MKIKKIFIALTAVIIFACQTLAAPLSTIPNEKILAEIQNYYENTLNISIDLTPSGYGIVPLPSKEFFQTSNIRVTDKSMSGDEATIIALITFTLKDISPIGSANWDALLKYFGGFELSQTFDQERKFLFKKYESGSWRLERELGTGSP